jgi:hypothetical protein
LVYLVLIIPSFLIEGKSGTKPSPYHYVSEFNGLYNAVKYFTLQSKFNTSDWLVHFETIRLMLLAFFKQVISNFCSTTAPGSMLDCRDFLLDRENTAFPERYQLHMYVVPDLTARQVFTGWQMPLFEDRSYYSVACLYIPPFAFLLYDRNSSSELPDRYGDMTAMCQTPWGTSPIPNSISPCYRERSC